MINNLIFLSLFPLILFVLLLGFLSLDKLFFLTVFLTPLSVLLSYFEPDLPFDLYLPTEPLIVGMLLLFLLKLIYEKSYDAAILKHPVTIIILIHLGWILVTSISSTMPGVSFKFLASRIWFIGVFYFLAIVILRNFSNNSKYIWLYVVAFSIVILYSLVHLSSFGMFDQKAAHSSMVPFFKDHTSYGAMLAFYLPVMIGFLFLRQYNWYIKMLLVLLITLFCAGILFSYTRAAWLSLIFATGCFLLIYYRIKFSWILLAGLVFAIIVSLFYTSISQELKQNHQDSDKDIAKHLKSVSNISTDASNLERINRWKCAIAMFNEKPYLGWGPGTYMFQYAPFQLSADLTPISTNAGTLGNAHSEYLGPLAEQGFLGLVLFLALVIAITYTGIRAFNLHSDHDKRIMIICLLTGLFTYFFHGMLNNFLDTDKASVPFWGFTAMLVNYYIEALNFNIKS